MSEREYRYKDWNKRRIILKYTLLGILVMIALLISGSVFLLSIDRFHECYRDFVINKCLKGDNYYDGGAWFSAAATFVGAVISAVPGLMCGILALVQTQRLHSLEARYHRPMMEIEKAEFSFVKLSNIRDDSGRLSMAGFDMRQRNGVYAAVRQQSEWWIDLSIVLFLNNGIAVKDMEIKSVSFTFPEADSDKEYRLRLLAPDGTTAGIRRFERYMCDKRAIYKLSRSLIPFVKFNSQEDKEDFENSISEFVFYNSEGRNSEYLYMDFNANVTVDYEYGEKQNTNCSMRAVFNAEQFIHSKRSDDIWEIESSDGYFTYEV